MGPLSILKYITNHPLNRDRKLAAVMRFVKWQIHSRLNPQPIIHQFTTKSKLVVQKGMTGATGNIYCGLHEFSDMLFLLHFLRRDELFMDIGANVGSYTVLGSAHVEAHTISAEPVPSTFSHLLQNVRINNMEKKVTPLNIALGATNGVINFTRSLDTVNHVATAADTDIIEVKIDTVDNILAGRVPLLMKIDVEGYETEVLKGASNTLTNSGLKAIIIELNGSGHKYGYDEQKIHDQLRHYGFNSYSYHPFNRDLAMRTSRGGYNTIYVRDIDFVKQRLQTADKFKIFKKSI